MHIDEELDVVKTTASPEVEVAESCVTEPTPTGSGAPKVIVWGCFGLAVLHVPESEKAVPVVVTV